MSWVRNPLAAPITLSQVRIQQSIVAPSLKSAVPPERIFAGTSGWAYPTWKPVFYPAGTPAKKFLEHYASRFNSVEVNHTFRTRLKPGQLEGWLASVPAGFRFSFKAPQGITHFKRLLACEALLTDFLESLTPAREAAKLGVILFQLPPNFKANLPRLRDFLALPALHVPTCPPIAFEFRHLTWFEGDGGEAIRNTLHAHGAALCIAESEDLQSPEWHTGVAHSCYRLRRTGAYLPRQITAFATRFRTLAAARDTYIYFKHEDEPHGALNALALQRALARKPR